MIEGILKNCKTLVNSDGFLQCGLCGENHPYSECTLINIKSKVLDKVIPSKARLTLPDCLYIEIMADQNYSIVAKNFIESGTKFGPLEARKVFILDSNVDFPLKVFDWNVNSDLEYYLNTCDENTCNWLMFISSATCEEEQNLMCFQDNSQIYYVTIKDVSKGEHLRAWYSPFYASQMKKNLLSHQTLSLTSSENITDAVEPMILDNLIKGQQKILARENWTCKFCGQVEKFVSQFAKHIKQHYADKQYAKTNCDACNKTFKTPTLYRRHLKLVHEKTTRPRLKAKKSETKVDELKNKDILIGGPLLNNIINDSMDNTGLLLQNIDLAQLSPALPNNLSNENILLDMSLNVDNLLNDNVKELDQFNFEVNDSHEEFMCDICLHSFSDLHRFLQHLNKHTGKFTCMHCMKVFCRKENLDAHNCSTVSIACELCQKVFKHRKHLRRHIESAHHKRFSCKNCHRHYYSQIDLNQHNCTNIPNELKPKFTCTVCSKVFLLKKYLQRHLKIHNVNNHDKQQRQTSLRYICEKCGKEFTSLYGFTKHQKTHMERTISCKVCLKQFHRLDVLNIHMAQHKEVKRKEKHCNICSLTFKTPYMLSIHRRKQHSTLVNVYKCEHCSKSFAERYLLARHKLRNHNKVCLLCNQDFENETLLKTHMLAHSEKYYRCPICFSKMKLRNSMVRHLKKLHPGHSITDISRMEVINVADVTPVEEALTTGAFTQNSSSNQVIADFATYPNCQSILDNFEDILNGCNSNDPINLLNNNDSSLDKEEAVNNESFVFEDFGIDLQTNIRAQSTKHDAICLSMPDITEREQEVTLGENAYILEDGTIVEPSDGGKLVVYLTS